MVFIHGGAFVYGTSNCEEDIDEIVVTSETERIAPPS